MKYTVYFSSLFLFCLSCKGDIMVKKVEDFFYQVKMNEYTPCSIPSFFEQLVYNHTRKRSSENLYLT